MTADIGSVWRLFALLVRSQRLVLPESALCRR
jgi:hypothetical protein